MNAHLLANAPPEPSVLFQETIDDLMLEAKNWLDGEPIANEEQATAVSSLLSRLRRLSNDADDQRKAEKKPHDDGAKEVQARWKPILEAADMAVGVAKKALAPWLQKLEDDKRAEAQALQDEADSLAKAAQDARQASTSDLQAAQDAERLLRASTAIGRDAKRASEARAHAIGGERAVGLVDKWTPELVDAAAALAHYRREQPQSLKDWLLDQARKDVHAGVRVIPGFQIHHERIAR